MCLHVFPLVAYKKKRKNISFDKQFLVEHYSYNFSKIMI